MKGKVQEVNRQSNMCKYFYKKEDANCKVRDALKNDKIYEENIRTINNIGFYQKFLDSARHLSGNLWLQGAST